jgi:hypothetical protein
MGGRNSIPNREPRDGCGTRDMRKRVIREHNKIIKL